MRRTAGIVAIAVVSALGACGELRSADEPSPAPTSERDASIAPADAGRSGDAAVTGEAGVEPRPLECREPCPVEALDDSEAFGALAVGGDAVYYAADTRLFRCPKSSGQAGRTRVVFAVTRSLALYGGDVYWGYGKSLRRCPLGGCGGDDPEALGGIEVLTETRELVAVKTDGAALLWQVAAPSIGNNVRMCTGGTCSAASATTLVPARVIDFAVHDGRIVWSGVTANGGDVWSCTIEGCGLPTTLGAGRGPFAIGGGQAFFQDSGGSLRCGLTGCGLQPSRVWAADALNRAASDDTHLYWHNNARRGIYRCLHAGCERPEVVAANVDMALNGALALDADHVYWTSKAGLFRRHK